MFNFKKDQTICDIGGVKVGGTLRETPILLIGTIFYRSNKVKKSIDFNKGRAFMEEAIQLAKENKLGFMPDVYLEKGDDIEKIVDFVSDLDIPFLIDSIEAQTRISALKHCKDVGLLDKAVYNSINFGISKEEKQELRDIRPKNSILLAFNPTDNSVQGKISLIENNLLPFAHEVGIKNLLLDSAALPIGTKSLVSIKTILALKAKFGYPAGNGIHNVISVWSEGKEKTIREIGDSCICAAQAMMGADFILYGPVESSWRIFPILRMISDILVDE